MKPRRKKLYAALVLLGLVAVVVDRLIGPGVTDAPGAARADGVAPRAGTAKEAVPEALCVEAAPFPRHVPAPFRVEPTRDPFAPPSQHSSSFGEFDVDDPSEASATFEQSHRLAAVLSTGEGGLVIVDDQLLRVGQSIQECTLTRVEGAEATFVCFDGPITLHVDAPSGITP